jgi:hypothetical protein
MSSKLFDDPENEFEKIANKAWEDGREAREEEAARREREERDRLRGQQLELTDDPPPDPEVTVGVDEAVPGSERTVVTVAEFVSGKITMELHDPDPEWQALTIPQHDFGGLRPLELQVADVVRFDEQHRPVVRIYSPRGENRGLREPRDDMGGLMADFPGVALLRGKLSNEPIPLPPGTGLPDKLKTYPFSGVRYVAIGTSLQDFCKLVKWASTPDTWERYGGVPVIGAIGEGDADELGDVDWPKGLTFVVIKGFAEQLVTENVFGAKVITVKPTPVLNTYSVTGLV